MRNSRLYSTLKKFLNKPIFNKKSKKSNSSPQIIQKVEAPAFQSPKIVPKAWFPQSIYDLDKIGKTILKPGTDLKSELQSFTDPEYVIRRQKIAEVANSFSVLDNEIPRIEYNSKEQETWRVVYETLTGLHKEYACEEYLANFEELKKEYGISGKNLPQLQDVNEYLNKKSGFRIIPIAGMLTQRDFLSFLAFKIFTSTQYIRHHSNPFYSPEPDIIHELLGHVPMFANQEFADFSQAIGLASLGASDEDIRKLGNCYLFSVEFGLIKKSDRFKIYGAGVLSSAQEIENAMKGNNQKLYFEPKETVDYVCPLSDLQQVFFYSNSLSEAKAKLIEYAKSLNNNKTND